MDIDVFKHEYAQIEEKINTMFDRNAGAFLLNSETVCDIVNIGLHFFLKNVRPYAASCSEA